MRDGEIVGEKTIIANGMECLEIWIGLRTGEVGVFKNEGSPLLETIADDSSLRQGNSRGH